MTLRRRVRSPSSTPISPSRRKASGDFLHRTRQVRLLPGRLTICLVMRLVSQLHCPWSDKDSISLRGAGSERRAQRRLQSDEAGFDSLRPAVRGVRLEGGHEAGSLGTRVRFAHAPRGRRPTGGHWFRNPVMRVRFASTPLRWLPSEGVALGKGPEASSTLAASSKPLRPRRRRRFVPGARRFDTVMGLSSSRASFRGRTTAFQADDASSSLAARSDRFVGVRLP